MTREEQTDELLEVLEPTPARHPECVHDIEIAFMRVGFLAAAMRSDRVFRSKDGKASLKRFVTRLQRAQSALHPAIRPYFSVAGVVAAAAGFLKPSPPSGGSDTSRKRAAAVVARDLFMFWGHKAAATRGGKWERAAIALFGDWDAELFDYLRAVKRGPAPAIVTIRDANGSVLKLGLNENRAPH
jgi:hypothetical protein